MNHKWLGRYPGSSSMRLAATLLISLVLAVSVSARDAEPLAAGSADLGGLAAAQVAPGEGSGDRDGSGRDIDYDDYDSRTYRADGTGPTAAVPAMARRSVYELGRAPGRRTVAQTPSPESS